MTNDITKEIDDLNDNEFSEGDKICYGLLALAVSVRDAAHHLGTGDDATHMGAIEGLSAQIKEGASSIAIALESINQ